MTLSWQNRLFYLSGVLLYGGALLAGVAGQGFGAGVALTLVFALWQVLLHPERWPATAADLTSPAQWAGLALMLAVQALVVAVVLGAGRAIAALGFGLPGLPLALPLVLSALGVALARLAWNPRERAEMNAFIDEAMAQIGGMAPDQTGTVPSGPAARQSASDWLLAGFANAIHEEDAGSEECDDLVRQLVKLDEPENAVLDVLLEWQSFHWLFDAALLRYVGHPFTVELRIAPDTVIDWIEAALAVPETQLDAAAMAQGWLGKTEHCGGFGAAAPRLLALARKTVDQTRDSDLIDSLLALQSAMERPE